MLFLKTLKSHYKYLDPTLLNTFWVEFDNFMFISEVVGLCGKLNIVSFFPDLFCRSIYNNKNNWGLMIGEV
jgi:hypothetical protein